MRRFLFIILTAAIILIIYYYIQPAKKGKGSDSHTRYELVKGWPRLSQHFELGNPTGLGIDSKQNLIVFHRADREWPLFGMPDELIGKKTLLVLDKDSGVILDSWGEDLFIMPHGLSVDQNDNIWVTDVALHQVFKFNHSGKLLMKLGEAKVSGNDSAHFNRPTDVAVATDGSLYISDGYRNSRIIKFDSTGKYLFEWGTKGDGPGQFNIPHGLDLDAQGNVYVADRENNRVQVFTPDGKFLRAWTAENFGTIFSLAYNKTNSTFMAVDDHTFLQARHRGSDIYVFDSTGNVRTRFGRSGNFDEFITWLHDIATDKDENIYVGDILNNAIYKFKKQ